VRYVVHVQRRLARLSDRQPLLPLLTSERTGTATIHGRSGRAPQATRGATGEAPRGPTGKRCVHRHGISKCEVSRQDAARGHRCRNRACQEQRRSGRGHRCGQAKPTAAAQGRKRRRGTR
jgi:hypothetical protein